MVQSHHYTCVQIRFGALATRLKTSNISCTRQSPSPEPFKNPSSPGRPKRRNALDFYRRWPATRWVRMTCTDTSPSPRNRRSLVDPTELDKQNHAYYIIQYQHYLTQHKQCPYSIVIGLGSFWITLVAYVTRGTRRKHLQANPPFFYKASSSG